MTPGESVPHHQDMKTMQLVLKRIHDAVGHRGGILNFFKKEKM
ncbi:HNH endonuclease [Denitrobaculum tricleocarpae]|uniref:Uncharacterized protein n=1 Tax=Denitrobaculum tricleocarpae TaxID=2591009 RepID=A0A545TU95_9PROT|nr:hypothetical protein FKG95_11610 [Denitrobaculum tricleocarpae]